MTTLRPHAPILPGPHLRGVAWIVLALSIWAAPVVTRAAEARTEASGAPASAQGTGNEAAARRIVIEDDDVRIEELRVRGQTRSITVQPKIAGMRAYEIAPADPGRDPSQHKDSAGQRRWSLLSF